MATAPHTNTHPDIERLKVLVGSKKDQVKQQFDLLRTNLRKKEQSLCSDLEDIVTTAVDSYKGLTRSIQQLELGRASLEDTLKENHVLNLLEKTVVDLDREKQRLLDQETKTPRIIQLLWNLEPFLRELEKVCFVNLSYNSQYDNKIVNVRKVAGESFGFVIMSDLNKETTICRINENSPAKNSGLLIGDVLTELNGVDISHCTHLQIVEKIKGLTRICLRVKRISNHV